MFLLVFGFTTSDAPDLSSATFATRPGFPSDSFSKEFVKSPRKLPAESLRGWPLLVTWVAMEREAEER